MRNCYPRNKPRQAPCPTVSFASKRPSRTTGLCDLRAGTSPQSAGRQNSVNNYFLALTSSSKQRSNPAPVIFLAMCGCLRNHAAASSTEFILLTAFSKIRHASLEVRDRLKYAMKTPCGWMPCNSCPCNPLGSRSRTNHHPFPIKQKHRPLQNKASLS